MNNQSPITNHQSRSLQRWRVRALIIGIITAALSGIGAFVRPVQFFHSYLFGWLFWSGLSFGALVLVMLQTMSGGVWGAAVRNFSIAAFMTLPLMALLFLPILLGAREIYPWMNGATGEAPRYQHKAQWYTLPFFTARSVVYFAIFIVIALLLRRWTKSDDARRAPGSDENSQRLSALCVAGLVLYGFLTIFVSTDWVMSLDPKWFSTIFVMIFAAGQFLSALALMTALLAAFVGHDSLGKVVPEKAFRDLGSMLLAFVIFWTYVSFSQFLIIWSGNLPKEISWYLERSGGGWPWLAVALVSLQFFLPFFLLLSRARKSHPKRLARICLCILFANVLNSFWLVAPSFHPAGFYLHWLDLTVWLALGGFWFAGFFYFLRQQPLLAAELLEARQNA